MTDIRKEWALWLACGIGFCTSLMAAGTLAPVAGGPQWVSKIRREHPRMFFNRETWPQVNARAHRAARPEMEKLLRRCDGYPDDPVCTGIEIPKPKGGMTVDFYHTGIPNIKEWGTQSAECALAWRFTGNPKYLQKAKAMLLANVKGYQAAYENRRAVNWYSHTRLNSLCAYDWIYGALTEEERRAIILPLVRHVEDVQPGKGKPQIRRCNTGGYKTGCYGVPNLMWYAGLAAYGDGLCDEQALRLLVKGQAYHQKVLDFRNSVAGDDGGLVSGTPGYAMGAYPQAHFNIFHTWLSATGENLAEKYLPMGLYPNWVWWMWIPVEGRPSEPMFHGYGDAYHADDRLPLAMMYEHLQQYSHFFRDADPAAARLAATISQLCPNRRIGRDFPVIPFLLGEDDSVRPFTLEELAATPLKSRNFEQLGQIFMRSGWEPRSTYALFVAGTRAPMHKHHDEGSFVIYKHDLLALDTGCRAEQTDWNLKYYYAQSVAHNVVLIHKPGEPLPGAWGPRYDGPEGKNNYGGMFGVSSKLAAYETNARFSYAAADTGALYGEKCTENVRQFIHLQPDWFVVYDRVGASDPSYRKEWLLHTQHRPVVDGKTVRTDSLNGRLYSQTLLPKDAEIVLVGGPGKEFWSNGKNWELYDKWMARERKACARRGRGPYWGEWRAETHPGSARKDDRFLHVLTATDTNAVAAVSSKLIQDETHDGVELRLPTGQRVKILFNRGGSVGGLIGFGDEALQPLTEKVQEQKGVILE